MYVLMCSTVSTRANVRYLRRLQEQGQKKQKDMAEEWWAAYGRYMPGGDEEGKWPTTPVMLG